MLRSKYRNIIPNESEEKKNKDKSAYCETYDIGGMNNKVRLVIKSLYTEKSNFDIHGNFLYQIKNNSHFEIESELDFSKSSHYRTQEKNTFEPNKTLFISHIEPFQDLNKSITKEKTKKEEEDEDGICKVQYNRGYKMKTKIKLAFTFPSLEKQLSFVKEDHKEIAENLEQWKKFKPSQIEQLLLFYSDDSLIPYNQDINDNKIRNNLKNNNDNNNYIYNNYNNLKKSGNLYNSTYSDYKNMKSSVKYESTRKISNDNFRRLLKPSFEILKDFANNNNLFVIDNKEPNENNKNNNLGLNTQISNINNNYYFNNQENNDNINSSPNKNIFFVDESFPPCQEEYRLIDLNKEITTNEKVSSTEQSKDKKKEIVFHYRPIESLIPEQKQIFVLDDVNPYDIKCGLFKNKNIISVFAHLADYPYLLSKLFVENTINYIGIYKLKLFYQNFWTDIYVDKFIPCFPCYFPLYTYSPSSLWPCLLEKALAKIYRGYENLKYISYYELYQVLTGFPIFNFKKDYKSIDKNTIVNMLEQCQSKDISELENYTANLKFVVNSNYSNKAVEFVNKDDIINKYLFYTNINNNPINNISYSNTLDNKININKNISNKNIEDEYIQQNKINYNNDTFYSNSYLMVFYASKSYVKYLLEIKNLPLRKMQIKSIANKIYPAKFANEKNVIIKSIYNYQLKQLLYNYFYEDINSNNSNFMPNDNNGILNNIKNHNLPKESETLTLPWDIIFTIFDNVMIIKGDNYNELHFRNGFVRCQDVKSPDYDRILAHTYYELHIKKFRQERDIDKPKDDKDKKNDKNQGGLKKSVNIDNKKKEIIKNKSIITDLDTIKFFNKKNENNAGGGTKKNSENTVKDLIPVSIVINLSNDHYLDNRYYSREMDMKIGILQLINKKKSKDNKDINNQKKDSGPPFYGLTPVLVTCPDFQIGYSLVYDLHLEEGKYIIVPMTMGYCMQKNEKIKSFYYSLRDSDGVPLQIKKTVIPRFLDDVFYLNDPFCKNYLEYKVINSISKNILDNKGHKINKIDENSLYNNYSKIGGFIIKRENFGLSKLSFKDFIYEQMTLLNELQKKQCIQNLGYENNSYPYLSRYFGISFFFGKFKFDHEKDSITIIPKNNLVDNNMDSIINIRTLEKNLAQVKDIDFGQPKRVYYSNQGNGTWYTIEGVYMRKNIGKEKGENDRKSFDFDKDLYAKKNVFFSTNSNNITAMVHPGKLKFLLYVVYDVLGGQNGKDQKKSSNNVNGQNSSQSNDNENSSQNDSDNNDDEDNKDKDVGDSSMYSKRSKVSSEYN